MSNDRGKLKKYITQYMINKGSTSTKNLFDYCQKICPDVGGSIEELIKEINSNISEQSFLIEFATCEVTNQKLVIWCNKKNDDISRSQKHFSPLKLEYFQAILLEMLNSTTCYIHYVYAINISSTLTRRLTLYDAEIILMEWIRIGYFVKKSEDLYLGVRTITEFQPYLNKNPNKSNCELCNELVFTFKECDHCDSKFHNYCIQKYLKKRTNCPKCKNVYNEKSKEEDSLEESSSQY